MDVATICTQADKLSWKLTLAESANACCTMFLRASEINKNTQLVIIV